MIIDTEYLLLLLEEQKRLEREKLYQEKLEQKKLYQLEGKEIFYKFNVRKNNVSKNKAWLLFDDSKFYLYEIPFDDDCNYEYKTFLNNYIQFDEDVWPFIEHDIDSISRRIRNYIKYKNCDSIPIQDIIKFLKNDVAIYIYKYKLHDIIVKSNPTVEFQRDINNKKPKTFDFITVSFNMTSTSKDLLTWIKENKNHINKLLVSSVKDKLRYRYDIPINCLKVDYCILTKDFKLVYKLSLKDL